MKETTMNTITLAAKTARRPSVTRAARQQVPHSVFFGGGDRWTPKPLSLRFGSRETGFDPLDDHGVLELGKAPHHLKHRLAGGRTRFLA